MKNRRTLLALLGLAAAGGTAALGLFLWFRSGALPAGPETYYDARALQRTRDRLAAHRLNLAAAIQFCDRIEHHLDAARSVSWTNPNASWEGLNDLVRDLERLRDLDTEEIARLEAGRPGTWKPVFDAFLSEAREAYVDGLALNALLLRTDWHEYDLPGLQDYVIQAKDLCARLRQYPPFAADDALRTRLYPAFEEAYADRAESDPLRLRQRLMSPQPALTRWWYARLLQSRLPVPDRLCPDELLAQRDELDGLRDELTTADDHRVLSTWRFPARRAEALARLAAVSSRLAAAPSLDAWEAAADNDDLRTLAESGGADGIDPEIRLAARRIQATVSRVARPRKALGLAPTLAGVDALEAAVAPAAAEAICPFAPLVPAVSATRGILDAGRSLLAADPAQTDAWMLRYGEWQMQLDASTIPLGLSLHPALTRDVIDRALAAHWPEIARVDAIADVLEALRRSGTLSAPGLESAALLVREIPSARSNADREALRTRWETTVRPALSAFPRIGRRIQLSLQSLEQVTARTALQTAVELGDDRAIRAAAETILERPPQEDWTDLRRAAGDARRILDLAARTPELDLSDPAAFRERNARLLPRHDPAGSVIRPLVEARIDPLVGFAEALASLRDDTTPCRIDTVARAVEHLLAIRDAYPDWQDPSILLREALSLRAVDCLSPDVEAMDRLAASLRRLEPLRDPRLERIRAVADDLAALGRSDPGSEAFAEPLARIQTALADEALSVPGSVAATVRDAATLHAFLRQAADTPGYYPLRTALAELRTLSLPPPLRDDHRRTVNTYESGLNALSPLVRQDWHLVHSAATPADAAALAVAYRTVADTGPLPDPLQGYARKQADALAWATSVREFGWSPITLPDPPTRKRVHLRYGVLDPPVDRFGFGRRSEGRGSGMVIFLESGSATSALFRCDWRETPEDGFAELDNIDPLPGTIPWQWGAPVHVKLRLEHTLDGNRDLVPDESSSRSRWNPLDYGVFRTRMQTYTIGTFPSLEALVRRLAIPGLRGPDAAPVIQLDRLMDPELPAEAVPELVLRIEGFPEGRDWAWPAVLGPGTTSDARALGRDLRKATDELLEQLAPP